MPRPANSVATRQIEQIIRKFESLATFPSVLVRLIAYADSQQIAYADAAEVIESDPALTVRLFQLMSEYGIPHDRQVPAITDAMAKLPAAAIREAVLSTRVLDAASVSDDAQRGRRQLALHGLAVACIAAEIARYKLPEIDRSMAFSAGLLHDVGKIALDDVMPKSLERIFSTARDRGASASQIEHEMLGLDHATIGKRLARKWHLPEEISAALWLHHSDVELMEANLPTSRLASVVALADAMARSLDVGASGSYDGPAATIETLASYLDLAVEELDDIRKTAESEFNRRAAILGLDQESAQTQWCRSMQDAALKLSSDNTRLHEENRRLVTAASLFDFTEDLFSVLNSATAPLDIAAGLAVRWQKFFRTGPVCICIPDPMHDGVWEWATVDKSAEVGSITLEPGLKPLVPSRFGGGFALAAVQAEDEELLTAIGLDFDKSRTQLAPLMANNRPIGLVIFEQNYAPPSETAMKAFAEVSTVAGGIIALSLARQQYQEMAERFVLIQNRLQQARRSIIDANALLGLAEMAAGAAHELNTPLAVISGRSQLLFDSEADPQKKAMLRQITERASDASQIINDLLSFAQPARPTPGPVKLAEAVNAAINKTASDLRLRNMEADCSDMSELPPVNVDSDQVVSAVVAILTNAQESYAGGSGPVSIAASTEDSGEYVRLTISDQGAGMDSEVLARATQPFFSARPAGRQRGLGLAQAKRLILLNGGSLAISSVPGRGTTITITLPCVP